MIILQMELDAGFRKADINSIPTVTSETVFDYVSNVATNNKKPLDPRPTLDTDARVDYVQVRKMADVCEVRALVFSAPVITTTTGNVSNVHIPHVRVSVRVDTKKDNIIEATCEHCPKQDSCPHILAFIFWLHRKSTDTEAPAIRNFWGSESEALVEEEHSEALRIRDLFACDEMRLECDVETADVTEVDGEHFLELMLNEMEDLGLRDSALFRHYRTVMDEFEPLYVHHTLLDSSNNGVRDVRTFVLHMEDQAKHGLFDRLADVSKINYKTPLWLEAQYMRLRCSLIQRIASRKDAVDDEQIMQSLFCKERESNVEERQQLKQHKRFILKQTEKLENKTYNECGLLLSESYPYICAAPDGITDDHIVEIKAPKTDEEFEKYLEGRETIAPKYMAQIQIQMYMANVTKALYCVLSPTFDTNGALHYVWVQADMEFVASLLGAAEDFWKDVVFPRIAKIYLNNQ